jgi:hypothetical protein
MNEDGDNYGTTYQKSSPAISFPKSASKPGYGTKKPFVKAHGGDQYGVTMQKSKPFCAFPTSPGTLNSGSVVKRGY